jgi:hypothetical protein
MKIQLSPISNPKIKSRRKCDIGKLPNSGNVTFASMGVAKVVIASKAEQSHPLSRDCFVALLLAMTFEM